METGRQQKIIDYVMEHELPKRLKTIRDDRAWLNAQDTPEALAEAMERVRLAQEELAFGKDFEMFPQQPGPRPQAAPMLDPGDLLQQNQDEAQELSMSIWLVLGRYIKILELVQVCEVDLYFFCVSTNVC